MNSLDLQFLAEQSALRTPEVLLIAGDQSKKTALALQTGLSPLAVKALLQAMKGGI